MRTRASKMAWWTTEHGSNQVVLHLFLFYGFKCMYVLHACVYRFAVPMHVEARSGTLSSLLFTILPCDCKGNSLFLFWLGWQPENSPDSSDFAPNAGITDTSMLKFNVGSWDSNSGPFACKVNASTH